MIRLYYGDNLDVFREQIPDASVDLIYLNPPFNSNRSYNILCEERDQTRTEALDSALGRASTWNQTAARARRYLADGADRRRR